MGEYKVEEEGIGEGERGDGKGQGVRGCWRVGRKER